MNKYPYSHYEIQSELDNVIHKLEENRIVYFSKKISSEDRKKLNELINRLDDLHSELANLDWQT